jgi:AraC-like DNA-binding protein
MAHLGRSAVLRGFAEVAKDVGLDALKLASHAGIPAAALYDPDLKISIDGAAEMFESAAEISGVKDFGMRVAERRRTLASFGMVGLVVRNQPTVRAALEKMRRYNWLHNTSTTVELIELDEGCLLRIVQSNVARRRQARELAVAVGVDLMRGLVGSRWKPLEVYLPQPQGASLDRYRQVMGVTPVFNADFTGLLIAASDLDQPVLNAEPDTVSQLVQYLDELTAQRQTSFAADVEALIRQMMLDGTLSADRLGERLGMNRRTLHRKLAAEATSFSELLDKTREGVARPALTETDRSLEAIADLLGFSGISAFSHWFKRRVGETPSAYRASAKGRRRPPQVEPA